MKVNKIDSFEGKNDGKTVYDAESKPVQPGIVLRCFKDIESKPLRWLWPGRIPLGKLTMLIGDPGQGKSLLTIDIASRITHGKPFPDGAASEQGSVIFLNAEDDANDTMRPRQDRAGVDVSRTYNLESTRTVLKDGALAERGFSLEADCALLEDSFRQHPDVRMIAIDPISAYLGSVDSNSNAEVRGLLAPLAAIAGKCGVAIFMLSHLRKTAGAAVQRAIASVAFSAAPRAVWGVGPDPEDGERHLLVPVKQNLAADTGGLAYRVESPDGPQGIPILTWEPDPIRVNANDVLGNFDSEEQNERGEAKEWLKDQLSDGPVDTTKLQREAKNAGLSWTTVKRAKKELEVKADKDHQVRGKWHWELKNGAPEQRSSAYLYKKVGPLGPLRTDRADEVAKEDQEDQLTYTGSVSPLAGTGEPNVPEGYAQSFAGMPDDFVRPPQGEAAPAGTCSHCRGTGFAIADCPDCKSARQCCQCFGLGKEIEIPF